MIRCSCGAELFSIESICSVCIPSKPPRALFVEDLRIKLANRELEILYWKEAAEIANAENDDLRREVAATTKHAQLLNKMLGEAEARAERLRAVLKPLLNAKVFEVLKEILEVMEGLNEADAPYLKTLLDWHERARKALEDDKPIRAAGDGR